MINASPKFEHQLLGYMYKQDTVFQIFYFVKKKKKVEPCYCLHMCFIGISFK